MTYLELKPGDIRQKGDEVTSKHACKHSINWAHPYDFFPRWRPTFLIGYVILEADMLVSKYRRPQ